MNITLWGTRGSLARAGPDTVVYGGDTSSVEFTARDGSVIIVDAGSGIQRIGAALPRDLERVDLLLTHLHMDHIQGLGFFSQMFDPRVAVHVWGPISTTMRLEERLSRYLSPPLFPVRIRELPNVELHDVEPSILEIGPFTVRADMVIHPGPTVGYRIEEGAAVATIIPDHEPAIGAPDFPGDPEWVSGYRLAAGANILIHDAQYTEEEYESRVGWGHSSFDHALAFAEVAGVDALVTFHHDPDHSDAMLDSTIRQMQARKLPFEVMPGTAGSVFHL